MKKKFILLFIALIVIGSSSLVLKKIYTHEKWQSTQIHNLIGQVSELSERLKRQTDYYLYDIKWGDSFNYLAIGNSLTLIEGNWGRGICSSLPDNDYFGLVKKYLIEKFSADTTANRLNYFIWETAQNREKVLDLLDVYLSNKLSLVTIQLGENASDISSYKEDLKNLVKYIKDKAPKAKIIIIDDFWDKEKSRIRKEVAEDLKLDFADLSEIRGNKDYQSREGLIAKGIHGENITVSKEAETHPDDKGFKYIAEKIIDILNK